MSRRMIKIKVKCNFCKRWVFHTTYVESVDKMLCKKCVPLATTNPELFERTKVERRRS